MFLSMEERDRRNIADSFQIRIGTTRELNCPDKTV